MNWSDLRMNKIPNFIDLGPIYKRALVWLPCILENLPEDSLSRSDNKFLMSRDVALNLEIVGVGSFSTV